MLVKSALCVLVICSATYSQSNQSKEVDVSGYYSCSGISSGEDGEDKQYTGIVIIDKKADVYAFTWVLGGGMIVRGIGFKEGDYIPVGWSYQVRDVLIRGVTNYKVSIKDGKANLEGKWTSVPGDGKVKIDNLTFLKKLEAPIE